MRANKPLAIWKAIAIGLIVGIITGIIGGYFNLPIGVTLGIISTTTFTTFLMLRRREAK